MSRCISVLCVALTLLFVVVSSLVAQDGVRSKPKSAAALELERIRASQKARGYPEGQRGTIYSDDMEAVKREQAARSGGYRRDENGKRPTTDEAKLHPEAERQIAAAKLDKQLRDLSRAITERKQELRSASQEKTKVESGEGEASFLEESRLSSAKRELEWKNDAYERAIRSWKNDLNLSCGDFLTYEKCSCSAGAFSKRRKLEEVDEAQAKVKKAAEELGEKQREYEEAKAKNKTKRQKELTAKIDKLTQSIAQDEKIFGDLRSQRAKLDKPAGNNSVVSSGGKIVYDESAPRPSAADFSKLSGTKLNELPKPQSIKPGGGGVKLDELPR